MLRKLFTFSVLVIIAVTSCWAMFNSSFFRAHDFVHAARIAEMQRALDAGHIPPRWSQNFGYGYGMPLFNFYAPLPYIVGALLYRYVSIISSIKLLYVIAAIASSVGSYLFARQFFSEKSSLLASIAATFAPYRAVNIFVRGALSEVWGIGWMPWLFLGATKIAMGSGGIGILVLSTTAIILSHNLVALTAVVSAATWGTLLILYLVFQKKTSIVIGIKRFLRLTGSYLLGIGLSAWYAIPAVMEKQFTKLDQTILTGYFDFRLHFLYIRQLFTDFWSYGGSQWGPDDGISFFLGYAQLLALITITAIVLLRVSRVLFLKRRDTPQIHEVASLIALLLIICALGLTLSHSQPIWEQVSILRYFQFPWRLLSVTSVLLAFLVAAVHQLIYNSKWKTIFFLIYTVALFLPIRHFKPETYMHNPNDLYYVDAAQIRTQMSDILPDYISVQLSVESLEPNLAEKTVPLNLSAATSIVDRPHEHLVRVNTDIEETLIFPIAYFPGWRAEINGKAARLEPTNLGLLSLSVPSGSNQIGIFFAESPIRVISNILSIVSAGAASLYFWRSQQFNRNKKQKQI